MATTWDKIKDKLLWFLEEDPGEVTRPEWPERSRIDAWNMAQDIFCTHTAMETKSRNDVTVVNESVTPVEITAPVATSPALGTFSLPDDFIAVADVYDWKLRKGLTPYIIRGGDMRVMQVPIQYWVWNGVVHIEGTPTPTSLDLFYYAYWPHVTYDYLDKTVQVTRGDILVPQWAELPLLYLAGAILMHPKAFQASMNEEFKIKIDAGTPLDNPRIQQAKDNWEWYLRLLSVRPSQSRMSGLRTGPNR